MEKLEVHNNSDGSSTYKLKSPCGGDCVFLERDCGDFVEITPFRGVIISSNEAVFAVGGIPNEKKLKNGISFWFEAGALKYPKKLPQDPTEYKKVVREIHLEATVESTCNFTEAYDKARMGIFSNRESHSTAGMVEVNLTTNTCDAYQDIIPMCELIRKWKNYFMVFFELDNYSMIDC